jgi:hypothetical protein
MRKILFPILLCAATIPATAANEAGIAAIPPALLTTHGLPIRSLRGSHQLGKTPIRPFPTRIHLQDIRSALHAASCHNFVMQQVCVSYVILGGQDRIDPARVRRPYRRLGRGASAPDPANLRLLLQQDQDAPVIG